MSRRRLRRTPIGPPTASTIRCPLQYVNWMVGIVTRFDFGDSLFYNRPVSEVVAERLPRTILLALTCHVLASLFGITLGIIAATRQYSWADTALSVLSFLGMTVPRFLLAIIILYVLAFKLNSQSFGSFFSSQYGGAPWSWDKFVDLVKHVWPVVFIATFGGLAYNMRVMRANLLDVLNSQYVETARAKGMPESRVIMRHAVPNALHPLVAYQGVVLPYMVTGEIETAIVFGLPTVGPAHRRLAQRRRYVGDRDLHARARDHAHRRQHHRRSAARRSRSAHPRRGRQGNERRSQSHRHRFVDSAAA